jgi:hypothetical protein
MVVRHTCCVTIRPKPINLSHAERRSNFLDCPPAAAFSATKAHFRSGTGRIWNASTAIRSLPEFHPEAVSIPVSFASVRAGPPVHRATAEPQVRSETVTIGQPYGSLEGVHHPPQRSIRGPAPSPPSAAAGQCQNSGCPQIRPLGRVRPTPCSDPHRRRCGASCPTAWATRSRQLRT